MMNSKNYFNNVAPQWETMRKSFFPENLKEKIISIANLNRNDKVVDLGCGTGFLTNELTKKDVEIIAIDQSENMIEIIERKFQYYKNVSAKIGDGESIPLGNESVSKVVANMYIHHIEKPINAFKEVFRVLEEGGKFVFADIDEHNHEFLRTEQNDAWLGFNRADIEKWLIEAGFRNVEITCADSNCCSTAKTTADDAEISIFLAKAEK
jgi:ubiquinone/menaquinone biosynthesis C-methylase UbiE